MQIAVLVSSLVENLRKLKVEWFPIGVVYREFHEYQSGKTGKQETYGYQILFGKLQQWGSLRTHICR
jgi:hypothetical protein